MRPLSEKTRVLTPAGRPVTFRWTFLLSFATVGLRRNAAVTNEGDGYSVSGRIFRAPEIALMREVVATCGGLSRKELANTISELLGWTRPGGALKEPECLALAYAPVRVERVHDPAQRRLFRELVGRYHDLGYRVPFGAQLQYLVSIAQPMPTVVGCLQFSSAAWRMRARDAWIGWDDATRARHLPQVVSNSRFLVLPWIHIQNLASATLALALRRLPADWQAQYGVTPRLVETLVDPARYTGGCYRAANWVEVGETAGRGRDDRQHARHGAWPKRVFVYPLARDAIARLRGRG